MRYSIFLQDLVVEARVGIHAHEQNVTQRLSVSIDVEIEQAPPGRDDIHEVYDYERLVKTARQMALERHTNLLETLAERMAVACLAHPRVQLARVRLVKLDVLPGTAVLGLEVLRRRADISAV